jgi:hypothetical protein
MTYLLYIGLLFDVTKSYSNKLWNSIGFKNIPVSLEIKPSYPPSQVTCRYLIYRVAQKSVNLQRSLVLTEMFRFKPASRFLERYHSVVNCAMNTENPISNNFVNSESNKDISKMF